MSFRSAALSLVAAIVLTVTVAIAGVAVGTLVGEDETVADVAFAEQSVLEIQTQVATGMADVGSARVKGDITQSGVVTTVDLAQNKLGLCIGSLATAGGTARIIVNAEGQYLKGDQKFWKAAIGSTKEAKRVTAAVGQKWAKMPEARGGFGSFCTLAQLLDAFQDTGSVDGSATVGREMWIGGRSAVELISDGQPPAAVWVGVDAPHYVVRLVTEQNTLDFSNFNSPVFAMSPPDDELIDFTKL